MRHLGDQAGAAAAAPVPAGHVGLGPGLVDEHQALGVKPALVLFPSGAAAYWMGGHRRRVLAGERDWLLARLVEKPDLTLRALVAELVDRGIPASYGAVWRLLKAEGITVKKKPVRRRAGPPRRRPPARPMEEVPGPP